MKVTVDRTLISGTDARRVLGALGNSKYETWPGSFTQALVNAFCKADSENFARLTLAFPEIGAAMYLYKFEEDGHAELLKMAEDFS